ncbi:MAG: hypothetical protein P8X96_24735 [Desulfobacteraceae bacterium]
MICYMPFTHIEEPHLRMLAGALGTITLYSPAEALVTEEMRQWEKEALLKIKYPCEVDGDRMTAIVRDYKAWADVHQENLADMKGFFQARPEQHVMMEDTNPSQIRHQVRHYDERRDSEAADPLIDAALFLSLAQEFDTQQYAMAREMDAVQLLERQMMQQISGVGGEMDETMPSTGMPMVPQQDDALSPQMIPQRVRAWSILALNDMELPWLFATRSKSVIDHLLEQFAEREVIYDQPLISGEHIPVIPPQRMREMLRSLSVDPTTPSIEAPAGLDESAPSSSVRLILYRLTGVSPRVFLETFAGRGAPDPHTGPQADAMHHTLVGLVTEEAA